MPQDNVTRAKPAVTFHRFPIIRLFEGQLHATRSSSRRTIQDHAVGGMDHERHRAALSALRWHLEDDADRAGRGGNGADGYPEELLRPLGLIILVCAILYAVPRTAMLGA